VGTTAAPGYTGKAGVFGRAVLGDEEYERQQKVRERGQEVFGPAVTGLNPDGTPYDPRAPKGAAGAAPAPTAALSPAPPAPGARGLSPLPAGVKAAPASSIAEVKKVLGENPAAFDVLFAAECERAEGPRKGALRVFRAAEEEQGPSARATVLATIDGLLGA